MSQPPTHSGLTASCFRVNSPQVVGQIIEGEAIIINLASGNYYSLVEAGADIWGRIEKRTPVAELVDYMSTRYGRGKQEIEAATVQLIVQLIDEELIVECGADAPPAPPASYGTTEPGAVAGAFKTPNLEKFEDLADLIVLDPIHEVGAAGWPHPKPEPDAG